MKKEVYETPEMVVSAFDQADVITASECRCQWDSGEEY